MVESEDALARQALLPEHSQAEPRSAACCSGNQVPRRRVLQPALLALVYLAQMFGQLLEVRCQYFYTSVGSHRNINGETSSSGPDGVSEIVYSKTGVISNLKHINWGSRRRIEYQTDTINAGVQTWTAPIYQEVCTTSSGRFLD